jgi:hypothetical protein
MLLLLLLFSCVYFLAINLRFADFSPFVALEELNLADNLLGDVLALGLVRISGRLFACK